MKNSGLIPVSLACYQTSSRKRPHSPQLPSFYKGACSARTGETPGIGQSPGETFEASFRVKDRVHIQDMIGVGLIDETWPDRFIPELAAGLRSILDDPEG